MTFISKKHLHGYIGDIKIELRSFMLVSIKEEKGRI